MSRHVLEVMQNGECRTIGFSGQVPLLELARREEIIIPVPCGAGICGGCAVRLEGDVLPAEAGEQKILSERGISGRRLACRAVLGGDCRLFLDEKKPVLQLPENSETADCSEISRSEMPQYACAECNFPPDAVGAAVDLGTTTVSVSLVRLADGCELCRISELNDQKLYGASVMDRISACDGGWLPQLHRTAAEQLVRMTAKGAEACGIRLDNIKRMTVAGNTVMLHLLAGKDPADIGTAPYMPAEFFGRVLPPEETGLMCDAFFMPCVSGFVGGDLAACLAAVELPENAMLVDLGTNGEIALRHAGKFYTSSAAAGPALEGGGITCGSGAAEGAVSGLAEQNGRLTAQVIGGGRARSLCGSAIMSAVAILLKKGIIDPSGRMSQPEYPLVDDTFITARDVREVQLAKGAIAAAMLRTADAAGVSPEDIGKVIVTGALGCFIDTESALITGLVPAEFSCPVESMSSLALAGAVRCLYDEQREDICRTAEKCTAVTLGGDSVFDEMFILNMEFPQNDSAENM